MQARDISKLYKLPKEVRYCRSCVVSNQRPRIVFDDQGVCNACSYAKRKRTHIAWQQRERELHDLLDRHRRDDGRFDVIVPSSGGKDSAYVAHILKHKYGMHPLTATWSPNLYTEIGRYNFHKMIDSGLDNVLGTPNGQVNRRLVRLCLEELGEPFQAFIYGQCLFPVKVALHHDVSLIMLGENAEVEYGGKAETENVRGFQVGDEMEFWFQNCGVEHWLDRFSKKDLHYYSPPDRELVTRRKIERHFMGYYRMWVPQENYYYCAENIGFEPNPNGRSEGTYSKYASLDDQFDAFHYYFMLLKFGIGRATSDAAHEIRDGHLTREEGVALVRRYDAEKPTQYLKEFLAYCGITEEQYWEIADGWRNHDLWHFHGKDWVLNQQVT
jgi:N-acetyl sugar amidotransferase